MRELQMEDVFKAGRLIKGADLKTEYNAFYEKAYRDQKKGNFDVKEFGIQVIFTCFEKLTETKTEYAIYEFLAGPLEKDPKEVQKTGFFQLMADVRKWCDQYLKTEEAESFFDVLSGLMKHQ